MKKLILIATVQCLLSCQNITVNRADKSSEKVLNVAKPSEDTIETISIRKKKSQADYLEILKNYLLKSAEKDPELSAFVNENGAVEIDGSDGNFLSIYPFKDVKIYEKYSDGIIQSGAIVVISNEGGGGGGNVAIIENYLIDDAGGVFLIDSEITNAPKNKYGYEIYITGVEKHSISIHFIYRNEEDGFYAQGKVIPLKCRLIDYKLLVEN